MDAIIAENAVLDFAKFKVSWPDNSYEAHICCKGLIEKLGCGPLDQLAMHLPKARASRANSSVGSFKLHTTIEASSWFTKFTVARFLHVVNMPDVLKLAYAIENEICLLEETRKFQIALYAKNHSNHFGAGATDVNYLKDASLTQQVKIETSSDATKNELLRAMNIRLTALKEELATNFNLAAGTACGIDQISDLASFAQHFGAMELSNLLLKLLEFCPNTVHFDIAMKQQTSLNDSVELSTAIVSPAKVAQAERQNSSESHDSLDSSDQSSDLEIPHAERSRPVVRSTTPRRSASPMRRIQIAKSGSRRSTAVTIKSLNYFPARDKSVSIGDTDAKVNSDDELQFQPKKPERNVGRMSVQDAISLFERKQQDETGDIEKRKTADISVSANKSVLRRWSAGLGGSFNYSSQEKASDSCHLVPSSNFHHEAEEKKEDEVITRFSNSENVEVVSSTESVVTPKVMESKESTSTTEWNQRQEAELNEMLMKMMESSKPSKYNGADIGKDLLSDTSTDQRGGFYSQYKEKRDEKLRAENARNHTAKQAQLKVLHETLEKSKAAMASKTIKVAVKRESANFSQKPRRNSSPPVLMKKEASKPTGAKNASPKLSSPRTGSLPLGSLKKNGGTLPTKTSPVVSSNSMPSRRRHLPLTSPTQPSIRTEKLLEHMKVNKSGHSVQLDTKPSLKLQEDKQVKSVVKNSKIVKPRSPLSVEDCGALSKPIFSNKHAKKSTVVPVESKPFLRKGAGVAPGIGLSVAKAKDTRVQKSDCSSKNSGIFVQHEEIESNAAPTVELIDDYVEPTTVGDKILAASFDDILYNETTENVDGLTKIENSTENMAEPLIAEICYDDDLGISAAAWVETEHEEYSISCNNGVQGLSPTIAPVASSSSRVRHSLSQMLQAESGEPEIIEWGNAENPPSLVFQKDPPKGLKRLLKMARKSKGEGNLTGLSSPSVFSEGEEEHDSKSSDTSLQKASFQGKGYGKPRSMVGETLDDRNYSKKAIDYRVVHDVLPGSDKLHGGHISTRATTKASRSFFSLSSFRSSKSSETRPRH
ncbi:hypothetical protein KSP40_PGU015416 [Platanthera guangdongensis]|uniref:Uncharacterized protein n=1 Tax=Platanthera guangdongensis TaxID=2320717 RepID=A0ABR2M5V0_9ASPA